MPKFEQFPSKEEMEAAEQHLTPKQAEASAHRENVFERNAALNEGMSGALMLRKEGPLKEGPYKQVFEGELKGHKVILTVEGVRKQDHDNPRAFAGTLKQSPGVSFQKVTNHIAATVDGLEMSFERARKIYNKYALAYMSEGKTEDDLWAIEQEKEAFARQQIDKDLDL
jgi:hypothetical protein